jgi:hypothetical protein
VTIEELVRDTFHTRAELLTDGPVPARSSAARARARAIRSRRRTSLAAVAALAVVGAVAMVRVSSEDRADGPEPADLSDRVVSVRASYAGRSLIDSAETTSDLLKLRAGSPRGTEWLVACRHAGPVYVRVSVDGAERSASPCDDRAGLGDTGRFTVPAAGAGFESEVWVWVTDEEGAPLDDDGVLAVAAYALPEPYAFIAGHDVYPREENFGTEWSVLDTAESQTGQRSVSLEVPAYVTATMLELVSSGTGYATIRLVVDGEPVATVPATYVLGGRSMGDMLSGGEPHSVTLFIPEDDLPEDAQLGIVVRERALPAP